MKIKPFACSLFLIKLLTCLSPAVKAQDKPAVQQLDLKNLPNGIRYEGNIKTAVRWTDKAGVNVVITTETGIHESKKFKHENNGSDAELFAYHFLIKDNSAVRSWRVYDFIHDCPVDIEASFIENTFQVTDLNKDGVGEVWLMYKKVCHGDVSPSELKIIMYQGTQKFAIRGESKVLDGIDDKGNKHYSGGNYKFDQAFANGPAAFLTFAKKLWHQHVLQ